MVSIEKVRQDVRHSVRYSPSLRWPLIFQLSACLATYDLVKVCSDHYIAKIRRCSIYCWDDSGRCREERLSNVIGFSIRKMEDGFFQSEDDGSVDSVDSADPINPLEDLYHKTVLKIKRNDPGTTDLQGSGVDRHIRNITDESWEELGRDISNNTHLTYVNLNSRALNDQTMTSLFRGLTGSTSINVMNFRHNALITVVGVRSMTPFLHRANNLRMLNLNFNNLQSEGFKTLFRLLLGSPVENLCCSGCGIESIEIDNEQRPQHLQYLYLAHNSINADGCRELAKLLKGEDAILKDLSLSTNKIDDQGVDILVEALHKNTSLETLRLEENDGISKQGLIKLLKLVNDISSITATFQSNHTLTLIICRNNEDEQIQRQIDMATNENDRCGNDPEAAGKQKILQTQLNNSIRAELAELQGVGQSLYSEINPLYLPEVIALAGRHHGQGELYVALKSSIAGVISTVNRKQCLQQQRAHHEAIIAERRAIMAEQRVIIAQHRTMVDTIEAEIEAIDEAEGTRIGSKSRSSKRRRAG